MATEPSTNRKSQPEPSDSQNKKGESKGFIARLAERSTGLQPAATPTPYDTEESPWRIAGMGLQLVATTLVFAGMGYLLDREFGWTPWATLSLALIGLIGGLYLLIKEALKLTR